MTNHKERTKHPVSKGNKHERILRLRKQKL